MDHRENFQQIKQRIGLYFDNELNPQDQDDLLSLVQNDARCSKMFNKEKNFRDFIKNNVKRPSVSPDMIQSIRDRIKIV